MELAYVIYLHLPSAREATYIYFVYKCSISRDNFTGFGFTNLFIHSYILFVNLFNRFVNLFIAFQTHNVECIVYFIG